MGRWVKQMLPALVAVFTSGSVPRAKALDLAHVVSSLTPNTEGQGSDFLRIRRRIGTHLQHVGPAPDLYKDPLTREGVRLARYRSEGNELKVWHVLPSHNLLWTASGYPAVIYVHDGTSFSEDELQSARAFSEAGFLVLAPTFRGENGNPGTHELLFGELEDLVAAIVYATELPEVDKRKLAVWGHGLGGMLAALTSLVPRIGVQYTGSSAGLRPTSAFEVIQSPFESNEVERNLRVLGPNLHHMRTPHWACVAERDPAVYEEATRLAELARHSNLPLYVEKVLGDRTTSRAECTQHAVTTLLQLGRTVNTARAEPAR